MNLIENLVFVINKFNKLGIDDDQLDIYSIYDPFGNRYFKIEILED